MNRKAQASFEFLATYGWVLVGILGTVGMLMYFNVFDTSRYLPEECRFGQNIICEDFSLEKTSPATFDATFKLKNNLEKSIEIINVLMFDADNVALTCSEKKFYCPFNQNNINWTDSNPNVFNGKWGVGKSCRLKVNCDKLLVSNSKSQVQTTIIFRRITPGNNATNHFIKGKLFANVQ